jgi:hypothetical protein
MGSEGIMTYAEAMDLVTDGGSVRRSSWPEERFLRSEETWVDEECPDGLMIANHILHPAGGSNFGMYHPTPEDEAATDWESDFDYF